MAEPREAFHAEAVRSHLAELTESTEFRSAPRLARFLTFVVETTLAGNSAQIKETLIAVEVYGRKPDYDPQADSTVRVEASRLRSRLRDYYAARANAWPVRIEMPKGTYVPTFRFEKPAPPPSPELSPRDSGRRYWPAVVVVGFAAAFLCGVVLWTRTRLEAPVGIDSIGVLPFVNLSDDGLADRFCDVLTEEITTALAREDRRIRVASLSDRKSKSVRAVLEGSVRQDGERLIVTCRLVDTATGFHLWAERQERAGPNAAAGERDTAAVLLAGLRNTLRKGSATPDEGPDPAVLETYQKATELLRIPVHKDGPPNQLPASLKQSLDLFGEVTKRSPAFARGWAGLAEAAEWAYELRGNQPRELLQEAKAAALRATQLEPGTAEGWNTLTSILFFREWDFPAAGEACLRAMELDPRNAAVRQRYIDLLRIQGHAKEARFQTERAIKLQPTAPTFLIRRALMHYQDGRFEEALQDANQAAALTNQPPFYQMILWTQGIVYEATGRAQEAESSFRRALAHTPHDTWNEPALGHLFARTGRIREAEAVLKSLQSQLARRRMTWFAQALVQTALGRTDDALNSLERGVNQRDDGVLYASVEPRLRPLHAHPRFNALLAQLGVRTVP